MDEIKKEVQEQKVCSHCSQMIYLNEDHYVKVSTFNRVSSPDAHEYFHFACWVDFFNQKVSKRAKIIVSAMRDNALQVINSPRIKSMLMEVPNFEQVFRLMNIPLTEQDKIKAQIQNGRTRDRKKRKSKKK